MQIANLLSDRINESDFLFFLDMLTVKLINIELKNENGESTLAMRKLKSFFKIAQQDNYTQLEFRYAVMQFFKEKKVYGVQNLEYRDIFPKNEKPRYKTLAQMQELYHRDATIYKSYDKWVFQNKIIFVSKDFHNEMLKTGAKLYQKTEVSKPKTPLIDNKISVKDFDLGKQIMVLMDKNSKLKNRLKQEIADKNYFKKKYDKLKLKYDKLNLTDQTKGINQLDYTEYSE